jgi:tetratricopeptide (TPR) repeat protein
MGKKSEFINRTAQEAAGIIAKKVYANLSGYIVFAILTAAATIWYIVTDDLGSSHFGIFFLEAFILLAGALFFIIRLSKVYLMNRKILLNDYDIEKYMQVYEILSDKFYVDKIMKNDRHYYASCFMLKGDYEEAKEQYLTCSESVLNQRIRLKSKIKLAHMYYVMGDMNEFLRLYSNIKETIKFTDPLMKVIDAEALIANGDLEGAKEAIMKAYTDVVIAANPYSLTRLIIGCIAGDIEYKLGDPMEAAIKYKFALDNAPDIEMFKKNKPIIDEVVAKMNQAGGESNEQ